jgi:hypothetical protein
MEIEVLEGCIKLIQKYKPTILIETHDLKNLQKSNIFKELIVLGYDIFPIVEGSNDYLLKINLTV